MELIPDLPPVELGFHLWSGALAEVKLTYASLPFRFDFCPHGSEGGLLGAQGNDHVIETRVEGGRFRVRLPGASLDHG